MNKNIYFVIACGLALVGAGVAGTRSGSAAPVASQPAAREFVVRDVRVFDGERVIPKASVHVRDGVDRQRRRAARPPASSRLPARAGRCCRASSTRTRTPTAMRSSARSSSA